MGVKILMQNELCINLTYSNRVGEFIHNSFCIKRLAPISLLVLQKPLKIRVIGELLREFSQVCYRCRRLGYQHRLILNFD